MNAVLSGLSEQEILTFLVRVAVLLLCARGLGELCQRFGQPSVVGEILAGIILGPSLVGSALPQVGAFLLPATNTDARLLELVSLLGVIFLLFITGLEIDLALIRFQFRTALAVAVGGLVCPLAIGYGIGIKLPDHILVSPDKRVSTACFLAIAMAISAIPVLAKVLMELKLMRRNIAQTVLAAAMLDDVTGWILLSLVAASASGHSLGMGTIGSSIISLTLFIVFSLTAGRLFIRKLIDWTHQWGFGRDSELSLVVALTLIWAIISLTLHLEVIFGAFVAGVVFGLVPRLDRSVVHTIENIALKIFGPLFFAVAGLKVNLIELVEANLAGITLLVIVAAVASKFMGVYLGARFFGRTTSWAAIFYGAGLNARGSMGIIVASIGLSHGIISSQLFTVLVSMAVITSIMSPPLLRFALSYNPSDSEEEERLKREELSRESIVSRINQVLLPVRLRDPELSSESHVLEAQILKRLGQKRDLSLTILTAVESGREEAANVFVTRVSDAFSSLRLIKRVVQNDSAADAILDEARRGADLLILGAMRGQKRSAQVVFTPLVDYLIRLAPCPVLLVQKHSVDAVGPIKRILVPTNGSVAAKRAAEIGFALLGEHDDELVVIKVVEVSTEYVHRTALKRQRAFGEQVVAELREMGRLLGVSTHAVVKVGADPERIILEASEQHGSDLIILGTSLRSGTDRVYLGPRVEKMLREARCPVLVVNV